MHMHAKTSRRNEDEWHSSLEKYTSHFIGKGSKRLLNVLLCERWVGGWTELQHIDPHSYGHNSVSFPFSWAVPRSSIFSPTDWTSCAPSYIIIWRPLFFLRASQFRTQFNLSTVKVIFWYSSTGFTCYLHRCISYFDSLAGSEVNIQQLQLLLLASIRTISLFLWKNMMPHHNPKFKRVLDLFLFLIHIVCLCHLLCIAISFLSFDYYYKSF